MIALNHSIPATKPSAFCFRRNKPIAVLSVEIGYPLVDVGGKKDLSEVYFDAASASGRRAGLVTPGYDIVLSGGEPYAIWR